MKRHFIPVVVILVLALVPLLGCGQTTVYNNHKYGYSVESPNDWVIEGGKKESDTVCYGTVDGRPTLNTIVSVHITPMTGSQELHKVVMEQFDRDCAIISILDYCEEKVTKLSENHYQLEGRQLAHNAIQWFSADFVLRNNLLYEVTYTSADTAPGDSPNRRELDKVHVYVDGYGKVR
jgi:hypothetical protein